ncbi:MAG TPA: SDR family oxidoreductase [Bacteroidales bacterium]|nr:SDR family oxidoreductase [Bacteroidales bacterium]
MKIFVSGATGFIGSRLCLKLAEAGHTVHALYRSADKTKSINRPGILLFRGDIMDRESLSRALEGCEQAYHAAAFTKAWMKDRGHIYRLNIEGTLNIIGAASEAGVKKMVVTSTAGVFGPSGNGLVDERSVPQSFFIDYETSKFILEKILTLISSTGSHVVMVNPTRVYGEGPMNDSNGVTKMIDRYTRGKWHFIPGNGNGIGNYVHVDDVVAGHILAMEKGESGERYILGGENTSYLLFFQTLRRISGKNYALFRLPLFLMLPVAHLMVAASSLTGKGPLITPALVRKFNMNFRVSAEKAKHDLGYAPADLESGLKKTVDWLNSKQN